MEEQLINVLIEEFLSEDSNSDFLDISSDSESDEEYLQKKRNCIRNYFEEIVPTYTEQEFIRHFRVKKSLFASLAEEMEISRPYIDLDQSQCYSAQKHLAVFLWFAGHECCCFRDLADRFDLSLSTVCLMINRTTEFLSSMAPKVIVWPDNDMQKQTTEHFIKKKKLSGVIGMLYILNY